MVGVKVAVGVIEADVPTERVVVGVGVVDGVVEELTEDSVGVVVGVEEVEAVKAIGIAEAVVVDGTVGVVVKELVLVRILDAVADAVVDDATDAVAVEDRVA